MNMKKVAGLLVASALLCSCGRKPAAPGKLPDIKAAPIFETFVNALERKDYSGAFELLHPKLQNVWTLQRFSKEVG